MKQQPSVYGSVMVVLGVLVGVTAAQGQLFATPDPTDPRIPPLESAESPLNLVKTLAHHPQLSAAWLPFAGHILAESTLPARDRELVILRIGYLNGAEYEWGHHSRSARQVGISDEEILRIVKGPEAAGWSSFERALLRAVDELHRGSYVSEQTWAYVDARYDEKQLLDLLFTVGQYNMVSWVLRSLRVPMDEGLKGFPE